MTTYFLQINEKQGKVLVEREILKYRRGSSGQPWHFLDFFEGRGTAVTNELDSVTDIRAAEKINYPNLLVYCPVFCVASSGEYPDMHRLTRLEYGTISGAIRDNLFFPRP